VVYNSAEQKFKFFRTVFEKPVRRLRLRGCGAHYAFLLAPSFQVAGGVENELHVLQTEEARNAVPLIVPVN
jgi:hypothetical protein